MLLLLLRFTIARLRMLDFFVILRSTTQSYHRWWSGRLSVIMLMNWTQPRQPSKLSFYRSLRKRSYVDSIKSLSPRIQLIDFFQRFGYDDAWNRIKFKDNHITISAGEPKEGGRGMAISDRNKIVWVDLNTKLESIKRPIDFLSVHTQIHTADLMNHINRHTFDRRCSHFSVSFQWLCTLCSTWKSRRLLLFSSSEKLNRFHGQYISCLPLIRKCVTK